MPAPRAFLLQHFSNAFDVFEQRPVDVERGLKSDGQTVTLVPDMILNAGMQHEVFIGTNITGENYGPLGVTARTRFRTAP